MSSPTSSLSNSHIEVGTQVNVLPEVMTPLNGAAADESLNASQRFSSQCECRSADSLLEMEASACVREFSPFVQRLSVSDILPRTPELLFINLTTHEEHTYCIELTAKGWRVCSSRSDSMAGDFRNLALHTKYFDSPAALLDAISPAYRQLFAQCLTAKLQGIAT